MKQTAVLKRSFARSACNHPAGHINRRGFLEASVAAGIAASIGATIPTVALATALTKEQRDKMTPD